MRKRQDDSNKCPNCGYDLRSFSHLISDIKERGKDVQWIIDENIFDLESEFDCDGLEDALKNVLEFEEVPAFPTTVEKIKHIQLMLTEIFWMDLTQYDDDEEEDEEIRNQIKADFDKQKLKKEIDELVQDLKEIDKEVHHFFSVVNGSKFSSKTAKKLR